MTHQTTRPIMALGLVLTMAHGLVAGQSAALKIVVIEGEDAVNVIQQKTAVRALVEVRDRNNLPVAGASVTFTIGGGGQSAAFAGGVQTLTVTTNAAGQAAASGLNALSSGAFQIQVQAAYQGQIATATISQTNFATAAAAAQAGAGGGGSASGVSAGAASGGGGGLSATTIGIVGAAVGGGALAATRVVGKNEEFDNYSGAVSGRMDFTNIGINPQNPTPSRCVRTQSYTGTLKLQLAKDGATGKASLDAAQTEVSVSGDCIPVSQSTAFNFQGDVSGGPGALTFSASNVGSGTTQKVGFQGSLSGNTITGMLVIETNSQSTNTLNGITSTFNGSGSTTIQVTLQK